MNKAIKTPDIDKVKLTAAKMRDICTMFDAQIIVLDELIAQVEAENRNHPLKIRTKEKAGQMFQAYNKQQQE